MTKRSLWSTGESKAVQPKVVLFIGPLRLVTALIVGASLLFAVINATTWLAATVASGDPSAAESPEPRGPRSGGAIPETMSVTWSGK